MIILHRYVVSKDIWGGAEQAKLFNQQIFTGLIFTTCMCLVQLSSHSQAPDEKGSGDF